jgi:hypothetical protein
MVGNIAVYGALSLQGNLSLWWFTGRVGPTHYRATHSDLPEHGLTDMSYKV